MGEVENTGLRFMAETFGGGTLDGSPNGTLDTGMRFGIERDFDDRFIFSIATGGAVHFNTDTDAVADTPLRSIDATLFNARMTWRWNEFSAFAPFVEGGHTIRFNLDSDQERRTDPAVFTAGAGVVWLAEGPVTVFSSVQANSYDGSPAFLSGIKFSAPD